MPVQQAVSALLLLLCAAPASAFIGINLGNVLEAPTEGAWAPPAQEYYFDDYVAAGFTRVRVPVRWDQHMSRSPPYAIDAPFMARVHQVVGWGLARNLTVVVNSHHDDWADSSANFSRVLPRFLALWQQVADSFASVPDEALLFEVINEPVSLTITQLNQLYAAVVPVMRAHSPTRPIYLGGLSWMSPYWVEQHPNDIVFPALPSGQADAHLHLEVHSYDPYHFCLESPPTASSWGTPTDIAAVQSALGEERVSPPPHLRRTHSTHATQASASHRARAHTQHAPALRPHAGMYADAAAWGVSHGNKRVYMGEAGCQVGAPSRADRLLWYKTVGAASGVIEGITIWDDDGSWKVYDRTARTWDEGVLQALFGRR